MSPMASVFVGGGMRAGGGFRGGGRRSDARLKHDVMLLGHLDNGIGFYRFSYNGTNTCTTLEEMPGPYTRSKLAAEQRALEAAVLLGTACRGRHPDNTHRE